jgi:methylaspartate ammonia-lyase
MDNELLVEFESACEARSGLLSKIESELSKTILKVSHGQNHYHINMAKVLTSKLRYDRITYVDFILELEKTGASYNPYIEGMLEDFYTVDSEIKSLTPEVEEVLSREYGDNTRAVQRVTDLINRVITLEDILVEI